MFETCIEILLEPIGVPEVEIQVGNSVVHTILSKEETFTFNLKLAQGDLPITVSMLNKSDTDGSTAVIVKEVTLNGIQSPKITWAGVYYPKYPEPWASGQTDLKVSLPSVTHLGWNGTWQLLVTIPVFTWIHQTQNLGWIFE
jgi:hypothetical protein